MRRTKIVCTIGPASESKEALTDLVKNGMDVARLNFSHGSHEEHLRRFDAIKEVREELGRPIAILLDTKGPEIRLKTFNGGRAFLKDGSRFVLTTRDIEGSEEGAAVTYQAFPENVSAGSTVLLNDGLIELQVQEIEDNDVICTVKNGGEISDNKGVNLPGVSVKLPAVTSKDIDDIIFGIQQDIDFIAASFIRKAEDVLDIRRALEENGGGHIKIISKIENREGVENLDDIIQVTDGIMVARGDLGVEIPIEEVPLVQKEIIRKCNRLGKPVITATQMLDSMIRNPRPTRAEVADVANAILDGSDAVMLSGETAVGKYSVKAVEAMAKIAEKIEESYEFGRFDNKGIYTAATTVTDAISHATCTTAKALGARAIVTATQMGHTARMVSKYRPNAPILGVTPERRIMRQLNLTWGVYPVLSKQSDNTDDTMEFSVKAALERGYIEEGDLVVITAGIPAAVTGTTNLIRVYTVAKVITKGMGVGKSSACGKVVIITDASSQGDQFREGNVLVVKGANRDMMPLMEKASAIIAEEGGLTSDAAIIGLNLGKPTVVGVSDALNLLSDGIIVTVDAATGLIYSGTATVM